MRCRGGKKPKPAQNKTEQTIEPNKNTRGKKKRDCFLEQLVAKPTRKSLNESSTQMQKLKELCNGGGNQANCQNTLKETVQKEAA